MAPSEYYLRLQHGITGGFAPPNPSAVYSLTKPASQPALLVVSALRPEGTPSLQDAGQKELTPDAADAALIDELHAILQAIPTEDPPGSEDIYGMDTSIAWGSDDLQWANGGPQGCSGGTSMVHASDADKAKFRRAVEIVTQLVEKAG
ncbi:hypothetical protein C8J57DRAFT_1295829 [Mycena rebaudengoi]|nr:hypothetical protein C8J57DRAFT_1295829 [Mycena rebaudengoi]